MANLCCWEDWLWTTTFIYFHGKEITLLELALLGIVFRLLHLFKKSSFVIFVTFCYFCDILLLLWHFVTFCYFCVDLWHFVTFSYFCDIFWHFVTLWYCEILFLWWYFVPFVTFCYYCDFFGILILLFHSCDILLLLWHFVTFIEATESQIRNSSRL